MFSSDSNPLKYTICSMTNSSSLFLIEETEYEYSGSDEEDENRGDDRESR